MKLFHCGLKDFELLVKYLFEHHCVTKSTELINNIHPVLASKIFSNIKEDIASMVWGDNFYKVGAIMFEIVEDPENDRILSKVMHM